VLRAPNPRLPAAKDLRIADHQAPSVPTLTPTGEKSHQSMKHADRYFYQAVVDDHDPK
jgi:hypothetical protein